MYLNEHYIDHVFKWGKAGKFSVHQSQPANYVSVKETKETNVDHKLTFLITNRNTAKQLTEFFSNSQFNVVSITDFYIDQYNGIYNLVKGNLSADAGEKSWRGTIWLANRSEQVRYSQNKEDFDNDFATLQAETSLYSGLLLPIERVGDWNSGDAIDMNVDGGINVLTFGQEWWNSFVFEFTASTSNAADEFGCVYNYIDANNYYRIVISTHVVFTYKIEKIVDGVVTALWTLPKISNPDGTDPLSTNTAYDFKVIYSAGRMDFYVELVHRATIYDYDILAGFVGFYMLRDDTTFTTVSVTRYVPPTVAVSSGHSKYEFPQYQRNIRSRGKTLNNLVNFATEPSLKTHTSRVHDGEVKAWDTNDNDFTQTYATPQPLKWTRVYSVNHRIKGNLFVENGLHGVLYSNDSVTHYTYDQPYRKGKIVDIDFKQNPNYDVWNESYEHRDFLSTNQGLGNWDKDGLNFEEVRDQDASVLGKTDRVGSQGRIPQLDETVIDFIPTFDFEITFTPDDEAFLNGSSNVKIIADHISGTTAIPFRIYYHPTDNAIWVYTIIDSTANYYVTDDDTFPAHETHTLKVVYGIDQDQVSVYKDGVLINSTLTAGASLAYLYENESGGDWLIGDTDNAGYKTSHFEGNIGKTSLRLANQGKTITRQISTPLVWHSYDEIDWDNSARTFIDKGSASVDMPLDNGGTPPKLQKDGRYNQCMFLDGGSNDWVKADLTTELDGITDFTCEAWWKYTGTPAIGIIIRLYGTYNTFDIRQTTTNLTFTSQTSAGTTFTATVTLASIDFPADKWNHVAGTYDGTTMYLYVNGVEVASQATTHTPEPLPHSLAHGDGIVIASIDEFIISDYAKQPHEFGVMIADTYETGQWYNEYEFDTDEHGGRYRNSNPSAVFEQDLIGDVWASRGSIQVAGINFFSAVGSKPAKGIGKAGLSIQHESPNSTDGGGVYFGGATEQFYDVESDWTEQFYYQLDNTPASNFAVIYHRRFSGSDGSVHYIYISSTKLLYLDEVVGTETLVTDDSFALTLGQIYQVGITWSVSNGVGTAIIYVDGVLYRSYTLAGIVNDDDPGGRGIGIGTSGGRWEGKVSNFTIHDGIIPADKLGIFVDTQPLPRYSGYFKDYANEGSLEFTSGYTLRSITPEIVEVDLIDPHGHDIIKSWIERGDYFVKFDKGNHQVSSSTVNGIELYFPTDNQPRFSLHMDDTQLLTDTNLTGSIFHDAIRDEGLLMFDFPQHNMIFAGKTMKESPYNQYYTRTVGERIQGMIVSSEDGVAMLGYIPQRAINEIFWDVTQMNYTAGSYVNDTSDWFLSLSLSGAPAYVTDMDYLINYEYFPVGLYMFIFRGRTENAAEGSGVQIRQRSGDVALDTIQTVSTTSAYEYKLFNVTSDLSVEQIRTRMYNFGATYTAYSDYFLIIPLSNGHDFPLDLIRQSTTKRTNIKVLE